MSSCEEIDAVLRGALDPVVDLRVVDASDGCGQKFQVHAVSSKFEGVKLLARQRMVNDALKEIMPKIHALQMKCLTPEQWEAKREKPADASGVQDVAAAAKPPATEQ